MLKAGDRIVCYRSKDREPEDFIVRGVVLNSEIEYAVKHFSSKTPEKINKIFVRLFNLGNEELPAFKHCNSKYFIGYSEYFGTGVVIFPEPVSVGFIIDSKKEGT